MENFVVSARKYRPANFDSVVGQTHITTTLKNAIKDSHLAQALLFCGPRGVGKTTCARILAKAINCEKTTATVEPCNTCTSCINFNNQNSFNIYELDAASNNSVEDIRALVEQVRYAPQVGKHKVYIIDEVHMLSNAAFNAFLKTLEEPPSHAVFILATTEKHKIIPTILSRCQIFDFHRIQPAAIVQQLKHIAQQEQITCEEEALHLISQRADGALRDALSIFDLICTFASGQVVTYQATLQHLHILDHTYYFQLTDAFLKQDAAKALLLYDEILKAGFDGYQFIAGLTEHFRNLMVCQDPASIALLMTADNIKQQYQRQSNQASPSFLHQALQLSNQTALQYKGSLHKRLHVELLLIDLAHLLRPTKGPEDLLATAPPQQQIAEKAPAVQDSDAPPKVKEPSASATPKTAQKPENSSENSTEVAPKVAAISAKRSTLPETMKLPKIDQIKKKIDQPAAVEDVALTTPSQDTPLTQATVQQCCRAYAQTLQKAGSISAYNLLQQTIVLQDNAVTIQLINAVQQDVLAKMQDKLLAHLKAQLKNTNITLQGILIQEQAAKKPYTAQEKFNYLAEKHPALYTLQEKLKLVVRD